MSLDVGDVLGEGASRTTAPTGLLLMAGFAAVGIASIVAQHSYVSWAIGTGLMDERVLEVLGPNPDPMAVGMPVGAAIGLWLGTALLAEGLRIVAIRAFVGDHTDRIPATLATRRIGWAVLNGFVGMLIVSLLVGLGTLLIVLPGIFLALSFFFVRQVIAVEDANLVEAMGRSWELAGGNRVELAILGIVWLSLAVALWIVSGVVGVALAGTPAVATVVSVGLGAPLSVFGVAVGARAYVGLVEDGAGSTADGSAHGGDDDAEEDDGEEWPDPPGLEL